MTPGAGPALPGLEAWQSRGTTPTRTVVRLAWVDVLRGMALLGMMAYHGAWDLHAFGLLETDPSQDPRWRLLGSGVAGLFLALSGFGLSLAARQGRSERHTWLRLGRIAAAAMLVTVATRWAVPQAPIWFGILHCIVVTNILALALRSAPTLLLVVIGAGACAAPSALRGTLGIAWIWTGLAAVEPATLDFRPVLPWLAPVLLGVVLGRTSAAEKPLSSLEKLQWVRPLAWAGHYSLPVYLFHQPIMVGMLMIALGMPPRIDATVAQLRQPDQARAFLRQCRSSCMAQGGDQELCVSTCHCVLTAALSEAAAKPSLQSSFAGPLDRSLADVVAFCRRTSARQER